MVQGKVGGCPIWEALRTTKGRKARNALLQTLQACKFKDTCHLRGVIRKRETIKDCSEEEDWSTCWEASTCESYKEK
ncbi:MAG: hypothetical protein CMN55_00160 [Sneathiella sp.]|nr:hypothetical protein [Sneathiella sp.]